MTELGRDLRVLVQRWRKRASANIDSYGTHDLIALTLRTCASDVEMAVASKRILHPNVAPHESTGARRTDPASSHEAVPTPEKAAKDMQRVLDALRRWWFDHSTPPTARELATYSGILYETVHKRLPDLEDAGEVVRYVESYLGTVRMAALGTAYNRKHPCGNKPFMRKCTVTGKRACVWWVRRRDV